MPWYVLFVTTGYEHKIANVISRFWDIDGLRPFVPMYDARFRKAGKVILEKKRWFPGYVFLESDTRGLDFYLSVKPYLARSERTLKLLHYGNCNDHLNKSYEVNEAECGFLHKLLNDERCVELSQGYIRGTNIIVTNGPLIGHEGLIRSVNRHKMEATIETSFMGSIREVRIGLEIINRLP